MIAIHELRDLSKFDTARLEFERGEAILGIGAIKQKLNKLPPGMVGERKDMNAAKRAYGTVLQMISLELGRRRRNEREARRGLVEAAFIQLARARLPKDVFEDLLDEAVDNTREGEKVLQNG